MSTDNLRQQAIALREQAFRQLQLTDEFLAFRAMDDAVISMGGAAHAGLSVLRRVEAPAPPSLRGLPAVMGEHRLPTIADVTSSSRRLSQIEAAEMVLQERGHPMTTDDLMAAVIEKGATIGGNQPRSNFSSSLSRDDRFMVHHKDGRIGYWWLAGETVRSNENEAEPDEFSDLIGSASLSSSQEGGDANAATTITSQ